MKQRLAMIMAVLCAIVTIFLIGMSVGVQHSIREARITESPDGMYLLELDGEVYEYLS